MKTLRNLATAALALMIMAAPLLASGPTESAHVATVANGVATLVDQDLAFEAFESIVPEGSTVESITVYQEGDDWWIQAKGTNAGGYCLTVRANLSPNGSHLDVTLGSISSPILTESCSGVNCGECRFESDGTGCYCRESGTLFGGSAYCNHTITRGGLNGGVQAKLFQVAYLTLRYE